jgi:putative heme-binding domain-containing protein
VREAALHLLDQPPFSSLRFADLAASLGDADASVSAAARGLLERHRGWAGEAVPFLESQLAALPADDAAASALGSLFVAFQADPAVRRLITERLDPAAAAPEGVRRFLLDLLPALLVEKPEAEWLRAISAALENPALRVAGLKAAAAYPVTEFEPLLARLAEDPSAPISQRLLASRLSAKQPALSEDLFTLALQSMGATANAADRLGAVDLLARARLSPSQLRRLLEALEIGGAIAPDPLLPALARAADEETRPLLAAFFAARLKSGWSPARATFDQALVMFQKGSPERAPLTAAWERNNAAMLQRLSEFKPLLTGGDAERGREWFERATCAGCHRIGERGGILGPDLTRIGAIRSGGDLLESILYPDSSFAQGYEPWLLTRRDGEQLSGNLVTQGPDGVTLRDGAGTLQRVRPEDIAALDRQQLSAMPAGLEQLMTRDQFRDLLAYLQSLK